MLAEHVAAYAAGIFDASNARNNPKGLSWTEVSAIVAAAGMGSYSEDELADSCASYRRGHVAPGALRFLNQLIQHEGR
jgi:hypothetical protein